MKMWYITHKKPGSELFQFIWLEMNKMNKLIINDEANEHNQ